MNDPREEAPAVILDETAIYINGVRIEDRASRQFIAGVPEQQRVDTIVRATLLGIHLLETSSANGTVIAMTDQVQAAAKAAGEHVNNATQAMQRTLQMIVDRYCAEDGVLAQNLKKVGGEALDPDKAETLVKLRERIGKDIRLVFEPLAKQLTDTCNVNDETKPFGAMAREIKGVRESLTTIQTHLHNQAAITTAGRGNANLVGRSLENFVLETLGAVAAHQGEVLEDVRDVNGLIERSKAGDMVTQIDGRLTPGSAAKIVIEAKNRQKATTTSLLNELGRAMTNRGATVGLGVLVNATAPPVFYQNNTVIVNLPDFGSPAADHGVYAELLRIGYDMARFMGIQAARHVKDEPVVDLRALMGDIDELAKATKTFSTLKDNHTRIESAVNNARTTADQMKDEFIAIGAALRKRIADALKRAADQGQPDAA